MYVDAQDAVTGRITRNLIWKKIYRPSFFKVLTLKIFCTQILIKR